MWPWRTKVEVGGSHLPQVQAIGGGEGVAMSVDNFKTVIKQTAFYYHHVPTVPNTMEIKYCSLPPAR